MSDKGILPIDPRNWWFLDPAQCEDFKSDPVAQGYEVIKRHPGFPGSSWAQDHNLSHCPAWKSVETQNVRDHFYFEFKHALERMGLTTFIFVGSKAVSFDCRKSRQAILQGIRFEFKEIGLFQLNGSTDSNPFMNYSDYRTRIMPPDEVEFETGALRKWAVTIQWKQLSNVLEQRYRKWSGENLLAALDTFLTKNKAYREHRAKQIERSNQKAWRRSKRPQCEVIALGCAAWDWAKAGYKLSVLGEWLRGQGLSTLGVGPTRWHNYVSALKHLHQKVPLSEAQNACRQVLGDSSFEAESFISRLLGK